jgi:hypothetical protein
MPGMPPHHRSRIGGSAWDLIAEGNRVMAYTPYSETHRHSITDATGR